MYLQFSLKLVILPYILRYFTPPFPLSFVPFELTFAASSRMRQIERS